MKQHKIEPSLLEKLEQNGSESLAPVPVFLILSKKRQLPVLPTTAQSVTGTSLLYCEPSPTELRTLSDEKSVQFIWDANAHITNTPFTRQQSNSRTDTRTIVFDPQDDEHPADSHTMNGHGIKCAIIDTAADTYHSDLSTQIAKITDCTDDGNYHRGDQVHGTHVAGIVNQLAPEAELFLYKVFNSSGFATRKFIVDAIMAAIADGVDVINGSWEESGCPGGCPVDLAVSYAVSQGVIFCGSAGNSGPAPMTLTCPAGNTDIITIGACNCNGEMADFSSKGPSYIKNSNKPDISAPGVNIASCQPGGGYQLLSGTSMSAPVLTGACAIIKSAIKTQAATKDHSKSGKNIKEAIMKQAKDLGYDRNHQGAGLLNVNRTLRQLKSSRNTIFHLRQRELLRWAVAVAIFLGGAFLFSSKPWQVHSANTPVLTQTAQAQETPPGILKKQHFPLPPPFAQAQADTTPVPIGPQYSTLDHEQAATHLRFTISQVGEMLNEEIIR